MTALVKVISNATMQRCYWLMAEAKPAGRLLMGLIHRVNQELHN
jgi:hypothetical protein